MSSEGMDEIEKRLANRRDEIFKMMGEISKKTQEEFAGSLKRKMVELEQMADNAIKANDPLNAAAYQFFMDMLYFYMFRDKAAKIDLAEYRKQSDEYRKLHGL